jgi:hypothetical protein
VVADFDGCWQDPQPPLKRLIGERGVSS